LSYKVQSDTSYKSYQREFFAFMRLVDVPYERYTKLFQQLFISYPCLLSASKVTIKQHENKRELNRLFILFHFHYQPINVPTAGVQAFLMDYPQGERAITHPAGPVRFHLFQCYSTCVAYIRSMAP
jgi:hypothetical protein